ncbi:hypothetical protein A0128_03380 [Leptospira tipperaryensis]|uniref:Uncharacterized protein n=1 Tax=Leptospira tipperaryensis TaxID=2564040 RepID=A0A1D7UTT8_9LEPT|nr:hypothetical protein A0128_03380 [Leptospira tipperaryensis]
MNPFKYDIHSNLLIFFDDSAKNKEDSKKGRILFNTYEGILRAKPNRRAKKYSILIISFQTYRKDRIVFDR